MSKKFFVADLHHRHKNICKFTNRHLVTTQANHDAWLVEIWNSQVRKGDFVYILGDVSFSHSFEEIATWLDKLNGQKFIVKGNHDQSDILNELLAANVITAWDNYKEIKIKDVKTCMMHFPIASWNQQGRGSFHLHGHSHGSYKGEGRILDVGIDSAYNLFGVHRLFDEEDVYGILQGVNIYSADHHKIVNN